MSLSMKISWGWEMVPCKLYPVIRKTGIRRTQGHDDDARNQTDVLEVLEAGNEDDHQRKEKRKEQIGVFRVANGRVHIHAKQVVQEFAFS